ncbi:MAG: 2-oxoglutarate and iron-dependent oxygenase domain-containing protein, partial [Pirellulaceae bacterium]|nr:2-oxoglutarate and iron-dependent oxygenase domain-containing protein [Pirellulaceae bacterium]
MTPPMTLPIVDVAPLVQSTSARRATGEQIGSACRNEGFFYVAGHGVSVDLQRRLDQLAQQFFRQPAETKMQIRMERGGRAWRGFFPVGAELTSGQPDQKEGIYFGSELPADDPRVRARTPLHGANLFPAIDGFRQAVLDYLVALTDLGHALMRGVALSLGVDEEYFHHGFTDDPTILFRIFHYPPLPAGRAADALWSVGEHTDYGLLTILRQDQTGGLQVKSRPIESDLKESHTKPQGHKEDAVLRYRHLLSLLLVPSCLRVRFKGFSHKATRTQRRSDISNSFAPLGEISGTAPQYFRSRQLVNAERVMSSCAYGLCVDSPA